MEQKFQPRQIAYIVRIKDLLNDTFIKEDNWNPSYVKIGSKNVSRINIISTIISVNIEGKLQTFVVDDGTGKIVVKNFESPININVGEIILIVGRIRMFGNDRYITPEIVKKDVDKRWIPVWRKNMLKDSDAVENKSVNSVEKLKDDDTDSEAHLVMNKIRELDDGSGAPYNEISKIYGEKIISNMLMQGEIFQIKPGKLKVLD